MWWLVAPAYATWSVAVVDPETQEVGIAGATCGPFVWMIAEIVPGHGAMAAQYATYMPAKREAAALLTDGARPDEVITAITDADFDDKPELRQYGVAAFTGPGATFTGADNDQPALGLTGETWSVQGNTLATEEVVRAAAASLEATTALPLAERLMRAMEAASAEGGDHRCDPAQSAKSAFLFVARPDDDPKRPWLEARTTSFGNGDNPVTRLREEVDAKLAGEGCNAVEGAAWTPLLGLLPLLLRRRAHRAQSVNRSSSLGGSWTEGPGPWGSRTK
jgi:uncharacterized Ntn-hydrolase superfamily protein